MTRSLLRFKLLVPAVALAVVLACTILDSVLVAYRQTQALPPELAAKHVQVGNLLLRDIGRAVELGIPLESLGGLDQLFQDTRRANPEIAFVQFLGNNGTRAGDGPLDVRRFLALPVSEIGQPPRLDQAASPGRHVLTLVLADTAGQTIGRLAMGIDTAHVENLIKERLFDIVTVQIVTAIFAVEILLLLLDHVISKPVLGLGLWAQSVRQGRTPGPIRAPGNTDLGRLLRRLHQLSAEPGEAGGDRRKAGPPWQVMLRYVRFALFVFVFGDALPLSFLPLFARDLHQSGWGLSNDVLAALPVVAYWLPSALVQLPGARLLDRFTHRGVFAAGAVLAALGALGSAAASDLGGLIAARALAGLGLGLVFMVCQAAILTHVPAERRTMGLASFTGVFFLATFAGAALGGVLADQVGFRSVFLSSAVISVFAAAFAHLVLGQSREERRTVRPAPSGPPRPSETAATGDYLRLARNARFAGLLLLAALPNRMFNVALIFYLAPLYLSALGHTKAEIGRVVSVYGLTMAIAAPLLAAVADRSGRHVESVIVGTLICALGAVAVVPLANGWGVLLAVGAMGLGQALSIPSQMSLLPAVGAAEARTLGLPRVYAVFRAGERLPAFLGPLLGGSLAALLGFAPAIASYGLWLAASSAGLAAIFTFSARRTQA